MMRINETFNLGINTQQYAFLDGQARTPTEKFQKVKYTTMLYNEVLDGLVESFKVGAGSAKAWDFLKKAAFGKDYAQVVKTLLFNAIHPWHRDPTRSRVYNIAFRHPLVRWGKR